MTMLLLHDLSNPLADSSTHPQPLTVFSRTAFHGGAWRCGVKFGALGVPATIIAYTQKLISPYALARLFVDAGTARVPQGPP